MDLSKRRSTKYREGSKFSRCKPFFRVKCWEICNPIFMVLAYLIYVVLYICNSKSFKFKLSPHVIFNNFFKKRTCVNSRWAQKELHISLLLGCRMYLFNTKYTSWMQLKKIKHKYFLWKNFYHSINREIWNLIYT